MRAENIEDVLVYMHTGQWFGFGGKEKTYANLIIHSDDEKPTQEWLETELKSQQDTWDNASYARTRETTYPSIGDQLDMLWHAINTGDWTPTKVKTTEFYTALKAVKDANPKP